mgnify:CR=1 FL=1
MVLYTCEACNYHTSLKGNFKKHQQTKKHMKNAGVEKKVEIYVCQYCSKKYTRKDNLKRHLDHNCKKMMKLTTKQKKHELLNQQTNDYYLNHSSNRNQK